MATRNIDIIGSDLATGHLTFHPSDSSHTRVAAGDKIHWHIRSGSGVDSIESIEEKIAADRIWSEEHHRQGNHWEGTISSFARVSEFYVYLITWKRGNDIRTHDPLISIKPSHANFIGNIILKPLPMFLIGTLVGSLFCKKSK